MAGLTKAQKSHALANLYVKLHVEKHGVRPSDFNLYRDRRGFEAMMEDLGYERAQEIIKFYMSKNSAVHPCGKLLYNYDKINNQMLELAEDEARGKIIMEDTRKRVEEWRRSRGIEGG